MAIGSHIESRARPTMAVAALTAALLACALVQPPTAELAAARAAIADAEAAGAAARAPAELASARGKLAEADARTRRGHHDQAQLLAEQAAADARLATMKARAAAAETALNAIRLSPTEAPSGASTQ
jgi:Domain of unknown function (DUF4398)